MTILGPDGQPFRSPVETAELRDRAEKQADAQRRKAAAEKRRAEAERNKAEAERKKAKAERERSERLAAKHRELGIDPE